MNVKVFSVLIFSMLLTMVIGSCQNNDVGNAVQGTLNSDKDALHSETDPDTVNSLAQNPYTWKSAHHRPMGTGAIYAGNDHPSTKDIVKWGEYLQTRNINVNAGYSASGAPIIEAGENNTAYLVMHNGSSGGEPDKFPVKIYVPDSGPERDYLNSWDNVTESDNHAIFYNNTTGETSEFFKFRWKYGSPVARGITYGDLTGLGHGDEINEIKGKTAIGSSVAMGALFTWELEAVGHKITHTIGMAIPMHSKAIGKIGPPDYPQLLSKEFQWPATRTDGSANSEVQNNGYIPYGAILAIPPESWEEVRNLGLSEVGLRLAEAIRDYGFVVVDNGPFAIRCTKPIGSELRENVKKDMAKIIKYVRLVLNSTTGATAKINLDGSYSGSIGIPTYPTGGGNPIAPNNAYDYPDNDK